MEKNILLDQKFLKKLTNQFNMEKTAEELKFIEDTLEEMRKEIEPIKDTLVLHMFEIFRLEGVAYDPGDDGWPDDFFYVTKTLDGKEYWISCLSKMVQLKGKLDDEDYDELERLWKLNFKYHGEKENN